jgi:hypothetical protein
MNFILANGRIRTIAFLLMGSALASCMLDLEGTYRPDANDTGPDPREDGADTATDDRTDESDRADLVEDAHAGDAVADEADGEESDLGPCDNGQFDCNADGRAFECQGGVWVELGDCPLGCDGTAGLCYQPSNVPGDVAGEIDDGGLLALDLTGAVSPVVVDTGDGSITDASGGFIRESGEGMKGGIFFAVRPQPDDPSRSAGIFIMRSLVVPAGVTVVGVGSNPLILLITEGAVIGGTIDVGAVRDRGVPESEGYAVPGPGGYPGGAGGMVGEGPCPGDADGGNACGDYCTSGGGGGGSSGWGGDGGDGADPSLSCYDVFYGGPGGGPCGLPELRPLVGGSGGGGGGRPASTIYLSVPGTGGGGGGAIQITALLSIRVTPSGVITAPGGGGGGGDLDGGGGGGGGAGGSVLLESSEIILEPGSVVAANGGGGGSGDCT